MGKGNFLRALSAVMCAISLVYPSCSIPTVPSQQNTQTADSLYQQAAQYITSDPNNLKDDVKALSILNQAIDIVDNNPRYYIDRGAAKINLLLFQEAIADFEQAIRIEPKNAISYANVALCYNQLAQYDRAIVQADKAIALNPQMGYAYYLRSESHLYKGDTLLMCNDLAQAMNFNFTAAADRIFRYCNNSNNNQKIKMLKF